MPDFIAICHKNRQTTPPYRLIGFIIHAQLTQPELSARITPDEFLVCFSVIMIG